MEFVLGAMVGAGSLILGALAAMAIRRRILWRRFLYCSPPGGHGDAGPPRFSSGDREPRRPIRPAGSSAVSLEIQR